MADAKQAMVLAFASWGAKKYGKGDPQQFMLAFLAQSPQQQLAMLQEFQNDPEAQKYMQMAQQQLSRGATKARLGAKLNYIKQIKDDCPEGEELVYFKKGGRVCKQCMKKQDGGKASNPVEDFKKARMEKCGGKAKKNQEGGKAEPKYDEKKHERLKKEYADSLRKKKPFPKEKSDSLQSYNRRNPGEEEW